VYLDLRNNLFNELPESICELPALEKLDLRWNKNLNFPSWLKHLENKGCIVLT
jgi:Leucine-rich repeat (LRR) protein